MRVGNKLLVRLGKTKAACGMRQCDNMCVCGQFGLHATCGLISARNRTVCECRRCDCPPIPLSVCLSVLLSAWLSVYPTVHLQHCLPAPLFVCPSLFACAPSSFPSPTACTALALLIRPVHCLGLFNKRLAVQ